LPHVQWLKSTNTTKDFLNAIRGEWRMNNKAISLLVVDDDIRICELLQERLEDNELIRSIDVAHDGLDGLRKLRIKKPDVILLDLIMPHVDGLGFLEQAIREDLLLNTKIIVTSELSQDSIVQYAIQLGASFYMLKPYDMNSLVDRIQIITSDSHINNIPIVDINNNDDFIVKHLINSGIPVHTLGYKYFYFALQHLLQADSDVFSITKTIYPLVAASFKTSAANVDKAMRHSLSLASDQNSESLESFLEGMNYKNPKKKPSNSEYINLILERIKHSY
jgi:two-component system response regulator (stage 0 sporulation protein A)